MTRLAGLLVATLFAASTLAQSIPSPSQFLKLEIGKDKVLADYSQIKSYFRALDAASPRVDLEVLGKTTLGDEMIMAVISSEENIRNKARINAQYKRLSVPRWNYYDYDDDLYIDSTDVILVTC